MAQSPSMPPPPPPIRADKIGNVRDTVAPPLRSLPELPSDPPPLLPSVSDVGEAPTHESLPVQASPTKEQDLTANQGASKGWGLSSLFGGAKLPWSGSRKESRSAKVSAMPPPASSAQPIGTLMQDVDNEMHESPPPKTIAALQSSAPAKTIEAQSQLQSCEVDDSKLPLPVPSEVQDTERNRMDEASAAASCLPTQKPKNDDDTSLRDTASAEKNCTKPQTPADTRSEARSFIASLPKTASSSKSKVSPIVAPVAEETSVAPKVQTSALSTKAEPCEVVAIGVEATPVLNDSSKSETTKETISSMEETGSTRELEPLAETAPLAVISETIEPAAVVSETPLPKRQAKAIRPQSALQGRYIPGANSDRASSAASSRRKRPQQLDDVDDTESCVGSEYQLRYTGREGSSPMADGVRAEVLEAQEKIRKEWHDKLAGETDWNNVPHPKATLGRPHASTRDKLRPSHASSGRAGRSSATSSQVSSATSSPRGLGMPGPPLPGGFAPGPSLHGMPAPGSSQVASGSAMPGPSLAAPKGGPGRGPTLAPGPPLPGGPNSRGPGRALPAWALK